MSARGDSKWQFLVFVFVYAEYQLESMFFRHPACFRSFSPKHGRISKISKGALEGLSDTNSGEIGPRVSTSVPAKFHAFIIPFRNLKLDGPVTLLFTLLIQISLLRRNKNVFTSVIYEDLFLISRYSNIRVLSWLHPCTINH